MSKRASWNEYFLSIALMVSSRSTCLRRKIGAVAVSHNQILATGYNGPVSGAVHCNEHTCLRTKLNIPSGTQLDLCHAVHAEQNLICQAAKFGISMQGCTVYCTHFPCFTCAKMLLNVGVSTIYYMESYPDPNSLELIKSRGTRISVQKKERPDVFCYPEA